MTLTASEWAEQQWKPVDLGDQRLNQRAVAIGKRMAEKPEDSLPKQMQNASELEAAYRLLNNRHVNMADLLKPHCMQTLAAAREQSVVLWVEDTTELDYTAHPSTKGLGPIGNGIGQGLLLHSTLGILPKSRTVLGIGHVQAVLREKYLKKVSGWRRSPESQVWEKSTEAIGAPPEDVLWVHVSDRGSDIFEYMAACVDANKHFLVRIFHNRKLSWDDTQPQAGQEEAQKLLDYARNLPEYPHSAYMIQIAATKKQAARQSCIALAWEKVVIAPSPTSPPEIRQHKPLSVWVLRAWESDPPSGVEAVEWVLLSSLPILDLEDAQQRVDWYSCRWCCEDFHKCLKTGCQVERSQLDDYTDIQNLLGFVAPIAVRLLQLRQDARQAPDAPATTVIEPLMVEVLARKQNLDAKTMTVFQFWRWVARLGGFLGRKGDGHPGWRAIWDGWAYLSNLTEGARLILEDNSPYLEQRCD
jgi:hypothetical protein